MHKIYTFLLVSCLISSTIVIHANPQEDRMVLSILKMDRRKDLEATCALAIYLSNNTFPKSLDAVEELLNKNADPNVRYRYYDKNKGEQCYPSTTCDTPLKVVCYRRAIPASFISVLADNGADVNDKPQVEERYFINVCLNSEVQSRVFPQQDLSLLRTAVSSKDKVAKLLSYGAKIKDIKQMPTAYSRTASNSHIRHLPLFLSYGFTLEKYLEENPKPIMGEWEQEIYKNYRAFLEFKRGMRGLMPARDAEGKLQWSASANGRKMYAAKTIYEPRLPYEIIVRIGECLGFPEPKCNTVTIAASSTEDTL